MLIFIVPYRDREQQMLFFNKHMSETILEDINDFRILFIHQNDERPFNRGAMKNIGFLVVKDLYPENYKDITLVFNDVDTAPYTKNFIDYNTDFGNVKHFYGFTFTLGGIVSIKAGDFENINGFPNLWTWGYEDNELQSRAINNKLIIDRNHFYPIMDKNILQCNDGTTKIRNKLEQHRYLKFKTDEGISDIHNLKYNITDNMVNITDFTTAVKAPTQDEMDDSIKNQSDFINEQKKEEQSHMIYEKAVEKLPEPPQYVFKTYNNSKINMRWEN